MSGSALDSGSPPGRISGDRRPRAEPRLADSAPATRLAPSDAGETEASDTNDAFSHSDDPPKAPGPGRGNTVSRHPSHASSSRPLSVIARSERRGFLGRLSLVPEARDPYAYADLTKWKITATVAIATAGAPMGSSIFYPALDDLADDLGTTPAVINMSIALYMLSMSLFPLFWSALSEQHGRRTIYLASFALFVLFAVLCAVASSAPQLIVFRLLAGGASASVQVVGAGTIADVWEPAQRGRAMGFFYLGPLLGPMIAPIIGGALTAGLGWRATMWFLAVYGVVVWVLLVFLLPETLARRGPAAAAADAGPSGTPLERTATRGSAGRRTRSAWRAVRHYLVDPLAVLALLRHPPVLLTVLIAAVAFGALFILNIAVQHRFAAPPYAFSELQVGLVYLASGAGYFLASLFGGRWIDAIMAREARRRGAYDDRGRLVVRPEDRMRENAWLAQLAYPASLVWFGWSLRQGAHFMVPVVAMFVFGVSSMLHFALATTMLTEFVRKRSSAGVAVNNFVRNILSCVGTVVAAPWIDAVGVGWVMTSVAAFCLVFGCLGIWGIMRRGPVWRVKMDEALDEM